tara:strand:- start:2522 stop:5554 length:3033 start_codon:yes stop_codon:yes gene_type:complete
MTDPENPLIFPCGRGVRPGTQGPGFGGQEPTTTPPVLVPKPPIEPIPPYIPPDIPPQEPAVKCVKISPGQGAPSPDPGFTFTNPPYRQCMPCDGLPNTITDPRTGLRIGDPNNPSPGDAGCIYVSLNDCRPNCLNPQERVREPGDVVPPGGGGGGGQTGRPGDVVPPSRGPLKPITSNPGGTRFPGLPPFPPAPPPPQGPTTGGIIYYRCEVVALGVCPGEEGLPLNEATITSVFTECRTCSPNIVNANGSVEPDPTCNFSSLALCEANCISPTFTNLPCPPEVSTQEPDPTLGTTTTSEPGGSTTDPARGQGVSISQPTPPALGTTTTSEPTTPLGDPIVIVPFSTANEPSVIAPGLPQTVQPQSPSVSTNTTNQANQIISNQQAVNGNLITVNEMVEEENYVDIEKGISEPFLFDPNLNFFKTEPTQETIIVSNNLNLNVFKSEVTEEVANLLQSKNSTGPWDEITLQNLSDDKLLISLNPLLSNTFQYLRYPGGQPIGVSTLLNVVRKHLLEGTIDEFDPNYYLQAAEGQLNQKFDVLERPKDKELADRLAIKFLTNAANTYENSKNSSWRNFQINRVRPLNEDVKLQVAVTTLDGTVKDLNIPNDGFEVSTLSAVGQVTIPALGAPNKLNIGDGGGYYIDALKSGNEADAVYTGNIIPDSYYAPPSVRLKVLEMLDIDPAITITASSIPNQHEFIAGDLGASATKPLYFILDLSSVNGNYASNSLVENYSGTYTLLTASADIQRHVNNNALNTPMLSIDYRDPIYRYILDTSGFTASLNDFNLNGFKDKGFSSIGSRFVKNIPFGFVVTPVAGGKYNPFNGNSNLKTHGETHVRSLSVLPATDAFIDGGNPPMFRSYSLNVVSGVNSVGNGEEESDQNIGYQYLEEDFTQTFYSASSDEYGTSSTPVSAQGTAYMLREVIDYLSSTYSTTTLTWYDVFSRMPINKMGQVFYDSDKDLILKIANGLRGGIKIENIEAGFNTSSRIIAEDSKTIVSSEDRKNVSKIRV